MRLKNVTPSYFSNWEILATSPEYQGFKLFKPSLNQDNQVISSILAIISGNNNF